MLVGPVDGPNRLDLGILPELNGVPIWRAL
jgi:hypothetical protein